jgi:hypothetical protein
MNKNLDDYTREELLKIIEEIAGRGYTIINEIVVRLQPKIKGAKTSEDMTELSKKDRSIIEDNTLIRISNDIIAPLHDISLCFTSREDSRFVLHVIDSYRRSLKR